MKLLGRGQDPEFWAKVRESEAYRPYREELLKYYNENVVNYDYHALRYSDFKLFFTTGNRSIYESKYFSRRRVLETVLPLSLIYPEEQKYLDAVMEIIYVMCDEYTWCLPAHQRQIDYNDNSRPDLFCTETGCYLSMADLLLGDRLEPLIRSRIRYEVKRRVVDSYINVGNWWWENATSNWAAVCTASVAACFTILYPELLTEELIARMCHGIDNYLSGYNDDGVCLEGCGYWEYGVTFYIQFAEMMREFTGGKIDYFKHPKTKALAIFPQNMFLSGYSSVSFSDGGRTLRYFIPTVHRLKDEFPDDVKVFPIEYGSYNMGCGRLSPRLYGAIWFNEEYYYNPDKQEGESEYYAPDSQWFVKKCKNYSFAAKAGNNYELHNHNDVGSFIVAKNGRQLLMDLGSGAYTAKYFSAVRYEILEPSSRSHSVPVIDGKYQINGAEYKSTNVSCKDGVFEMDIAGAYGNEALRSLKRRFETYEDRVVMIDEIDGDVAVTERFCTLIEPKMGDHCVQIEEVTLEFDPAICEAILNSEPTSSSSPVPCYMIDFKLKDGVKRFEATIR